MRNWVYSQWKVSCAILPICTIIKNIYQILWCSISTIIYKCSTIAYIYQTHLSQMDNLNSSYCQKTNDAHRIKTIPQKITWHSHTPLFVRSKWKPAKPCVSSGWKSASCSWDASLLEWKGNTKKKIWSIDKTLPSLKLTVHPGKQARHPKQGLVLGCVCCQFSETNSSPLNIDLWKTRSLLALLETTIFRGELLVLGSPTIKKTSGGFSRDPYFMVYEIPIELGGIR